MNMQRLVEVGI